MKPNFGYRTPIFRRRRKVVASVHHRTARRAFAVMPAKDGLANRSHALVVTRIGRIRKEFGRLSAKQVVVRKKRPKAVF